MRITSARFLGRPIVSFLASNGRLHSRCRCHDTHSALRHIASIRARSKAWSLASMQPRMVAAPPTPTNCTPPSVPVAADVRRLLNPCLLYTSDAADEEDSVDL